MKRPVVAKVQLLAMSRFRTELSSLIREWRQERIPIKKVLCRFKSFAKRTPFLLAVIATVCNSTSQIRDSQAPARAGKNTSQKRSDSSPITFEDVAASSRISFQLSNSVSPHRYLIETMTGGVALLDYDNDGLLDIFLTNGAAIPTLDKSNPKYWNRLYHNNGDGTFTDVTEKAGVTGIGYSMGVAVGDYDNDGFEDIYVAGVNANQLLHNNRDGTFTDVTAKAGVGGMKPDGRKSWSVTAGWFDYNRDGNLDLLVINYLDYDVRTAARCSSSGTPTYCSPNGFQGTQNILYRNNGDGTFTDVSDASGISKYVGKGMAVAFADYDGDGLPDIFISNDTFENWLLHNNGDGTFTDVALQVGVAYNENGRTVAGMGTDFRDIDNDGRPDIFQTAMFGDAFPLYLNVEGKQFQDVTTSSGLTAITSRWTAWGAGIFDFDNDGLKDIFTANSEILDNSLKVEHRPYSLPNGVFRNRGGLRFEDLSHSAGSGSSMPAAHRGSAFGDLNNDGKIDVVETVLNGKPKLLMNRSANKNHWLILKLVGVKSNHDGIGTKVEITTTENGRAAKQYNEATTTVGYNSSSDKRVHFGLGPCSSIDSIALSWPSGIKQVMTGVKPDQVLTVTEAVARNDR
jgi:enediyne biosynthesis protein E4